MKAGTLRTEPFLRYKQLLDVIQDRLTRVTERETEKDNERERERPVWWTKTQETNLWRKREISNATLPPFNKESKKAGTAALQPCLPRKLLNGAIFNSFWAVVFSTSNNQIGRAHV